MRFFILFCALFFSLPSLQSAPLETNPSEFNTIAANQEFDKINLGLSVQNLKLSSLNTAVDTLTKLSGQAGLCIEDAQKKLDNLNDLMKENITTPEEATSADLVYLGKQQKNWANKQAQCRLFSIRAHEAIDAYKRAALKLKEEATLARGMPLWTLYHAVADAPESGLRTDLIGIPFPETVNAWLIGLVMTSTTLLVSLALLLWLRKSRFSVNYLRFKKVRSRHVLVFAGCLLSGILFADASSTHLIQTDAAEEMRALTGLIFIYFLACSCLILMFKVTAIRALFYWYTLDYRFAQASLFFFLSVYFVVHIGQWLNASGALSPPFWDLCHSLFLLTLLTISFTYIICYCRLNREGVFIQRHEHLIRNLTALFILIPTVLTLLGYLTLATQLTYSGFILIMILFFTATLVHGIEKIYRLIDQNKATKARIIAYFGYKKDQKLIEFLILKITAQVIVLTFGLFFIAKATGFSNESTELAYDQFLNGFHLANMTVNPTRILIGVILFCLIYLSSRALSNKISGHQQFEEEEETQVAVASILTYIGFALALISGLLIAGFNFTGLAIIAGALSVGIGLGLQSIVNNFVSGLILLIEKPIKPGDRIRIDGIEGFVKKIRVRSTQLITPSREDIIIPNSDLITRCVTNYMLTDKFCRISFAVGVAYGSNTELVRDTLLEIADLHEEVIKSNRNKPIALFQAFGESELVFELSCLIKDVNKKALVQSELHFTIERIFRERNIEMPFPQRDINLKFHELKKVHDAVN